MNCFCVFPSGIAPVSLIEVVDGIHVTVACALGFVLFCIVFFEVIFTDRGVISALVFVIPQWCELIW